MPRAAQLTELGEDETNRLGHMFVRIDIDLPRLAPAEAGREHEPVFPALRLGVAGGDAALPQQAQLIFRHRPLQPQQQAIIDESRIIGAVRVDDQGAGQRTQVDQVMCRAERLQSAAIRSIDRIIRRIGVEIDIAAGRIGLVEPPDGGVVDASLEEIDLRVR